MRTTIRHPRVLTDEQVGQILSGCVEWKAAKVLRQLAKELGVYAATACNVIRKQGKIKWPSPDRGEEKLRVRREPIAKVTVAKRKCRRPRS